MKRLIKGLKTFQKEHFKKEADFFKKLAGGQAPDVLFFACSDSRVDPNLITQSKPGELFIVKNVGNIIPAKSPRWKQSCTAATIEFALIVLKVTDIVVCGHSDCGALKALYFEDRDFKDMPNLKDWISTVDSVKEYVLKHLRNPSQKARAALTEKRHIVTQLEHLKTYPMVREGIDEGRLSLHGWHYDIGTGSVYAYNDAEDNFDKINYNEDGNISAKGSLWNSCEDIS